jgi:hypothetical protein
MPLCFAALPLCRFAALPLCRFAALLFALRLSPFASPMSTTRDKSKRNDPSQGWTKQDLLDAATLSAKTFDTLRKAARIKGPGHGGLSWVFSIDDVIALIHRAESGQWTDRGAPAAVAWRALLTERGIELD